MNLKDFHRMLRDPHVDPAWGVCDTSCFVEGEDLCIGRYRGRPTVVFQTEAVFMGDPSLGIFTRDTLHGVLLVYDGGDWYGDIDDVNGNRASIFRKAREIIDPACTPIDVSIVTLRAIARFGLLGIAAMKVKGINPYTAKG